LRSAYCGHYLSTFISPSIRLADRQGFSCGFSGSSMPFCHRRQVCEGCHTDHAPVVIDQNADEVDAWSSRLLRMMSPS
jgi:hypothetical protein